MPIAAMAALWMAQVKPASAQAPAASAQAPAASAKTPAEVFNRYCVTCHSARLKTGGFTLDTTALSNVPAHAEMWEKVIRKLRSNAMPPAGAPRPDPATYQAVASSLENELDRAAASKPVPGKLPLLHRLSRTEYQNAIRDLLALDALPKEMDYSLLLPPDNSASGFDNLADLLFVSPTIMERYLDAARKISRLAVGDPNAPLMVNIYRLGPEQPQDARVEELPFGTRGGLAIRSDFPQDGEYGVRIEMAGPMREPHKIEISVDGEQAKVITLDGNTPGGRGAPASGRNGSVGADKALEYRIPVKAGSRLIGVTFIERTEARDENTLRPRMRGRGSQPAIGIVTISGPYNAKGPGETPSRQRIFTCHPATSAEEPACAKQILTALERRAYRHSVTDVDVQDLMPFFTKGRTEGNFDLGIERAVERMLVSPQFLFRVERNPAGAQPGSVNPVSDLELASRLSFFLWSSIPDDQLLDLAQQGKLHDPAVLEKQVNRMLADDRSISLVNNFAAQWLFLRDIEAKQPDELLFPDFDETLRAAMHKETELFLNSVLRGNRSVLELLTANYTFVNERLAKHYGIPNVEGSYFRRVTFPPGDLRGGLLGQGSILTLTSYATRTSPVVRGKWVLENLLNSAPPPPPPDVPALKTESSKPGEMLSMREAMTQHRANPACAGCHARMDPIGFAMENFNAVGQWRDTDAGKPIDVSGVLPDGTKFNGMDGLKQGLMKHPDQFTSTVAEKLLMYAIGRNPQYYDAPEIRTIVRDAARSNNTFAAMVLSVVKSAPFQMREVTETKAASQVAAK